MDSSTIDNLLSKRKARRIGETGDKELARSRSSVSRFLAEHFTAYDRLRGHLLHPEHFPIYETASACDEITQYLEDLYWINRTGVRTWTLKDDFEIRSYLSGGWLEEYAFLAYEAAGTDEVYFGQKIEWKVGSVVGKNEIDVIARRGDTLSFTSCKTIQTGKTQGHMAQLRNFLTEADYWDIHFAGDNGRALLIVTADFIDEMSGNSHRYPQLMARASILDVSVAGLESLAWAKLVQLIKEHWR